MNTQQAYPISWPPSWPRTKSYNRKGAPFFQRGIASSPGGWKPKRKLSMSDVVPELYNELKLIGVGDYNVVVSTNVELRLDGQPYSNRVPPVDPGAAVYFKLKGKPCVLACDKWNRVEDNLSAIARHIEALRGQERWGVGSVEQAFAGYTALPPAGTSVGHSWWDVLGCAHDAPLEVVKDAFREKARAAHPDNGGSHEAMVAINAAWDQARRAFGA
jgi:hypothetical protein